ncbi:MAG: AsmA-like C-terminal domain-containing protein [Desulfuromonadales bacterium]|nr:AsmA-like C-terminal domain-containing protein [Desulfuromonadales bacterium]
MLQPLRRHPVITLLTLLLGAAAVALTLFLYSFNLNDYRSQLQAGLQEALQRPVQIGAIHFTLRHGLSLELSDTAIGTPEEATFLVADHLRLRLRITPLLQRQLSFSSVLLDGAQLRINVPAGTTATEAEKTAPERMKTFLDLLRRTNISTLILHNGHVSVMNGVERYALDKINLKLHNIAFQSPVAVTATGEIHSGELRTPWRLSGKIEAASADAPWQETRVDLSLGMKELDLAQLPLVAGNAAKDLRLAGIAKLQLHAQGDLASGLSFELRAESPDATLTLPTRYATPLHVGEIVLGGIWQSGAPGKIRDLRLRVDSLNLHGALALPTETTPLTAAFSVPETPLQLLGPWVPDRTLPRLATALRNPDVSGSAALDEINLRWSKSEGLHLDQARFHLRDGQFTLKETGLVKNLGADGALTEDLLTINSVKASLLGGRSQGTGTIAFPPGKEAIFNLQLASTAQAEALSPLLPAVWQEKLQARGPISFSGKIGGSPSRLLLDLQSRFEGAEVLFNHIPLKRPGERGELLILGAVQAGRLELSHARLLLPFAEARANGYLALDSSGDYTLACDINDLLLEKLPPFLAVQQKLQGHGEVDLRLDLSGDRKGLRTLQGSGEFRKLGMHLWASIANLRGASGRMIVHREGIEFPAITGILGISPVRASAELKWLPKFQLTLDLDLAKTRAADLVFNSPQKIFSSIQGRLVISGDGILFEQIAAEIANETKALINGHLTYTPASLVLDIVASHGNIAGIIALWQKGEKAAPRSTPTADTAHPLSADISVAIANGDLFGVSFKNAAGTVALRNGALQIEPLRLEIGAGHANVVISTGPLRQGHPLLKISGQAEKIDAAQVQKQLLGKRGSISGTLSSSFTLQGEIGRFLPTCNGNINLRLNQGLMRGFTSISRALALFNVGKILTFNFPDVDKDGLLFDRIKGNLTLTDGVLHSEDLAVSSPAFDMAFVGKADLVKDRLDFIIGVKPLQTVDKVLSHIPLAGWILTGEKKAFIVANFHVTGSSQDPVVEAIPFSSLSDMAVGIFKRTFGLPSKIVDDVKELFK